jgi:Glycosyl hydrolase-like 10
MSAKVFTSFVIISIAFVCSGFSYAEKAGMNASGVVTYSDWTHVCRVGSLRTPVPFNDFWGSGGVEYIVDSSKQAGMTRLYWRIFGGSVVKHNTQLDEDGDGAKDMIITDQYRFNIPASDSLDNEPSYFKISDFYTTGREIRLKDAAADLSLPVTIELHLMTANLSGNASDWDFILRYADGTGNLWDLKIMGSSFLRNSTLTSLCNLYTATNYNYIRFVCDESGVTVYANQDLSKQVTLVSQPGSGNYFAILSNTTATPQMYISSAMVTSGAHTPPSKFPYEEWDQIQSNYGTDMSWYQTSWLSDWQNQSNGFPVSQSIGAEIRREDFVAAYEQEPTRFGVGKDLLSCAIDYTHEQDMELYAWISIGEENHYGHGPLSRYVTLHPEHREVDMYGRTWGGRLSFTYPEVRAYKLSVIRELVNDYGVDGIMLDYCRRGLLGPYGTGGEPAWDGDGACIFGYDALIRSEYQAQYGVDPQTLPNNDEQWIQFRNEPWTDFLREIKAEFPDLNVVPMVFEYDAAKSRKGELLDWETWLDEGLVDGICFLINNEADGTMYGVGWDDRPIPLSKTKTLMEARIQEINGRANAIAGIYAYGISTSEVTDITSYAFQGGADEVMWWETASFDWASGGAPWDTLAALSPLYTERNVITIDDTGCATISWEAFTGKTYTLQYRDSLGAPWDIVPNWNSVSGVEGVMQWCDDGTDITAPHISTTGMRFYRVSESD